MLDSKSGGKKILSQYEATNWFIEAASYLPVEEILSSVPKNMEALIRERVNYSGELRNFRLRSSEEERRFKAGADKWKKYFDGIKI